MQGIHVRASELPPLAQVFLRVSPDVSTLFPAAQAVKRIGVVWRALRCRNDVEDELQLTESQTTQPVNGSRTDTTPAITPVRTDAGIQ